jgi:hypothetical protein
MKPKLFCLVVLGALAFPTVPLYAQSADEKPQTSVFDQHPECMSPNAPANANCVINDGLPRRHVVGAEAAAVGAEGAAAESAPTIGGTILTAPPARTGTPLSAGASGQNSGKGH